MFDWLSLSGLLASAFERLMFIALYLENGGAFPKPLSSKDEQQCFIDMAAGDRCARQKLIEHNLRLVAHIVKKYAGPASNSGPCSEQEDLISIGTIGLIKAVSTFLPEKGARFATYASRCIENEILMHFRGKKKSQGDVYIDDPIETDKDGNQLTLLDIVSAVSENDSMIEEIDLMIRSKQLYLYIKDCLNDRELTIISCRYGLYGRQPMTQREVADKLNISRSYVSRIEKKALCKLKTRFDKGEGLC